MLNNKENIMNIKRLTKKELEARREKQMQRLQKFMKMLIAVPDSERNYDLEELVNKAMVKIANRYNNEMLRRVK